MKKLIWILAAVLPMPVCWAETTFEYSAVTLSYAREFATHYHEEPQYIAADLSIEIASRSFVYASIQSGWVKCTTHSTGQSVEHNININDIKLGYGSNYALTNHTDFYARLGLLITNTDADVITRTDISINTSSEHTSDAGISSEIGLRSFINTAHSIELSPTLQLTHINEETSAGLGIAIGYYPSKKVQIQAAYLYDFDTENNKIGLDFRLYGKSF